MKNTPQNKIKELKSVLVTMCEKAVIASRQLSLLSTAQKNSCLELIAQAIESTEEDILAANEKDVDNGLRNGLSSSMIDRLRLDKKRIKSIASSLRELIKLEDPVGKTISTTIRPNGLEIKKISVPIGVIGIIYESRPNVTVDAAGLCLKSGNAVILRGGSESINSNLILAKCISEGCITAGLQDGAVQLLPWTDREAVNIILKMNEYIDLIIPRGGETLIRTVVEESTIPVIKHYKGICNIYVDDEADIDMAIKIIVNAKCQRPGVCNAVENVFIHEDILKKIALPLAKKLSESGVELRSDEKFKKFFPECKEATEQDWHTEYLSLILSIKVVPDINEAINYINRYGSRHSDLIITENRINADIFMKAVDTSTVYHNASTRFTDGYEFGLGAEIGISTDKLHARGPMGLNELNTYKYFVYGNGQIRK